MRTRWLAPFTISLGLTTLAVVACNNDDGDGDDNATQGDGDGDSSESSDSSSTTDTDTTADTETTTGDGDGDTTGCTPGELGCDCNNGLCLGDLECIAGTCVNPECIPGELGCECNNGQCLGDLECSNGICADPDCTPGELACECNNGLCLGALICEGGICLVDGDTDTDTTDTGMECPEPNEKMCDGECVDVMFNLDHCGECGNTCEISLDNQIGGCANGACKPFWSECYTQEEAQDNGFLTCAQVCASEGRECDPTGCKTETWIQYGDIGSCNSGNIGGVGTSATCETEILWETTYLRCCCSQ